MTGDFVEKENDELLKKLVEAIEKLYPYFDSIQIFAVKHVDNKIGTTNFATGKGDFFSRFGLISLWVKEQKRCDGE